MATAERQASTIWEGPLATGSGQLEFLSSGAGPYPVTWPSRVEKADGRTSPEELLAAAHASCFSMALSAGLGRAGNPPERLHVTATVSLDPKEGGGFKVARSHVDVAGKVPGIDQDAFASAVAAAAEGCPISGAIAGNVDITHTATLES